MYDCMRKSISFSFDVNEKIMASFVMIKNQEDFCISIMSEEHHEKAYAILLLWFVDMNAHNQRKSSTIGLNVEAHTSS